MEYSEITAIIKFKSKEKWIIKPDDLYIGNFLGMAKNGKYISYGWNDYRGNGKIEDGYFKVELELSYFDWECTLEENLITGWSLSDISASVISESVIDEIGYGYDNGFGPELHILEFSIFDSDGKEYKVAEEIINNYNEWN